MCDVNRFDILLYIIRKDFCYTNVCCSVNKIMVNVYTLISALLKIILNQKTILDTMTITFVSVMIIVTKPIYKL